MAWSKSVPTTATYIVDASSIFTNNWSAIDSAMGNSHYNFSSTIAGRHKPGIAGMMFFGTTAEVSSLTTPDSGALAFDYQKGATYRYTGSAWTAVSLETRSFVRGSVSSVSLTTTNTSMNLTFSDNLLTETSTYAFSPKVTGVYLVDFNTTISGVSAGTYSYFQLWTSGMAIANPVMYYAKYLSSSAQVQHRNSLLLPFTANSLTYLQAAGTAGLTATSTVISFVRVA